MGDNANIDRLVAYINPVIQVPLIEKSNPQLKLDNAEPIDQDPVQPNPVFDKVQSNESEDSRVQQRGSQMVYVASANGWAMLNLQ